MEKEKLNAVKEFGVLKVLNLYNHLCKSCRIKSIAAVRKGGNAPKVVFNKYCDDCKDKIRRGFNK